MRLRGKKKENKINRKDGETERKLNSAALRLSGEKIKMNKTYIHETAIVDAGAKIGEGTKVWHFCHVMGTAEIGKNSVLGQNVFVGNNVKLGNNVKVQNNVSVYEGVVCEDDVFLGPSMVFTNVINPRSSVNRKQEFKKTLVKKGTTIGANATIVCGVTLGEYCFIGAGAVITKSVKPFALMVGVPAKQKGWVSESGNILSEDLVCPETNEEYEVKGDFLALPGGA